MVVAVVTVLVRERFGRRARGERWGWSQGRMRAMELVGERGGEGEESAR